MILLIDNYDSFVFNLARYFQRLGQETHVVRNDAIDADGVRKLAPAAIVLSPGPCTPNEAGCSLDVVRRLWQDYPILGVCLGHQTIAAAFGAVITQAPQPMHGRTSAVDHDEAGVYQSIPSPFTACRYHSLVVEATSLPDELIVTSRTSDGVVMGLQHRWAPIVGVQFHPESVLTEYGFQLLNNFLVLAGLTPHAIPTTQSERLYSAPPSRQLPTTPVTF
ncbi:MAG: aminodeoxychorismate/anthranilate synthase component II [Planctomycetota bacterium]|nr:aminodeoxychorismate/anthranilate synthase component II [Planctomycetota bacterium]